MEHVTEKIINIGVNDSELTLFEGQYAVKHGMAYNSYVILDEKTAVMDTVDGHVTDDWLSGLEQALNGRTLDYLVIQHMEPDHSGSIQDLADRFPDMKIVSSAPAFNMMKQFFEMDLESRMVVIKEGDTLELGEHTLQFYTAPMVHWPEVMSHMRSLKRLCSVQMGLVNSGQGMLRKTGPVRPGGIISTFAGNMVCRYRHF